MSELNKLSTVTNAGQFVHDNQVMSSGEGFKNVSKLWYDQTSDYEMALTQLEREAAEREDITEEIGNTIVGVDDKGQFQVEIDGRYFTPTMHAIMQLAGWADVPQTLINHYMKPKLKANGQIKCERTREHMELIVSAFRLGYKAVEDKKKMLFRTYNDSTLRAVLSDSYLIIDNRWYLETLKELLPEGRVSHWKGDADIIFGNILIPDTIREEKDSDYGGMLSVGNSEIGTRRMQQRPSVFRAICMNGCIWDQVEGEKESKVHRGKKIDYAMLRAKICNNLHKQIPLLQDGVDRFLALRSRKLEANPTKFFAYIANDNSLGNKAINTIAEQWLKEEGADKTAFGVINAITRAGQKFDASTWYDMDVLAGQLMNMSDDRWTWLNKQADGMEDKAVAKIFSLSV